MTFFQLHTRERLAIIFVLSQLLLATWGRLDVWHELVPAMIALSAAGLVVACTSWWLFRKTEASRYPAFDCLVLGGTGLTLLSLAQLVNSVPGYGADAGLYHDWHSSFQGDVSRPFSINSASALLGFCLCLSGLSVLLLVRRGLCTRAGYRGLVELVVFCGGLFCLFALVQYASGTNSMFWTELRYRHFFGTFWYENKAGAFCYIQLGLVIALFFERFWRRNGAVHQGDVLRAGFLAVLFATSLLVTYSRTAMLFGLLLGLLGLYFWAAIAKGRVSSTNKFFVVVGLAAAALVATVVIWGQMGSTLRTEFLYADADEVVADSVRVRIDQWVAAVDIWRTYPAFGVGYAGFTDLLPLYVRDDTRAIASSGYAGSSHNDYVQALCEYGVVGVFFLCCIVAGIVRWFVSFRRQLSRRPLLMGVGVTFLCVLAHAVWDMPFRSSPLVVLMALMVGVLTSYLTGESRERSRADRSSPSKEH